MVQLAGWRRGARRNSPAASAARRVARALVFEPKLILMTSRGALDKQLREPDAARDPQLHQRLGLPWSTVTHDQAEAHRCRIGSRYFTAADQQLDSLTDVRYPKNAFVALSSAEHRLEAGWKPLRRPLHDPHCRSMLQSKVAGRAGAERRRSTVSLRPERANPPCRNTIDGHPLPSGGSLREIIYLGDHVRARVALPGTESSW